MSRQDPTTAEAVACPYLGLADDRETRFSFPAQAHRCHAGPKPTVIELAYQGTYCLSSRYTTCDRYHSPASGARSAARGAAPDPVLSAEAAVAAEAEALAEATGDGVPVATEPVAATSLAAASTPEPEPVVAGRGAPEQEHGAGQLGSAVPGSATTEVPAAEPAPQRAAQAVWTRHGWSTPEFDAALDEAMATSTPADRAAEQTEVAAASGALPANQAMGPADASEPEAASPEPEPASAEAEPASAQAEPAAEPKAEPKQTGRRPATPPPSEWRNAKTSSVLASVLPSYDLVTGQPTPGEETADADAFEQESIAIVPPKGRRPTTPPPSAWKSTTTTSILAAIMPPVEPIGGEASTNGPTPADVGGFPPQAEVAPTEPAATAESPAAPDAQPQASATDAQVASTVPEASPILAEVVPRTPVLPAMEATPAVEPENAVAQAPTSPEAAWPPAPETAAAVVPTPSPAEPAAPEPPTTEPEAGPVSYAEPATTAEPATPTEPIAPVQPVTPVASESAVSGSSLTHPAVWPPPGSEPPTPLPEDPVTVPPRRRPWFADATPVADARARLPETAPVLSAPGTAPGSSADAQSRKTPQRPGARRNIRRRAFILIVVLLVAALAAAIATGSLERLLPAGLLPAAVILPSSLMTQGPFAPSISPVGLSTPSRVPSQGPSPSPTATAQPTPITHVVQSGESLTSIATLYGVTPQAIRRANNLKDANLLQVGQKLIIPPPS